MTVRHFPSKSEERGLSLLNESDLAIYSVGISTAGWAEIAMAKAHPKRSIIATTIDEKGAEYSQRLFKEEKVSNQITTTVEDIAKPLPYENNSFNFIYARLVLHYLSKSDLDQALEELFRILKPGGQLFAVVLSNECSVLKTPGTTYEPSTGLTTITSEWGVYSRYFHTENSLREHFKKTEFFVSHIESYDEMLCWDYERQNLSKTVASLLEILAVKN